MSEQPVYYSLLSPEQQGLLQEIARAAEQACVEQSDLASPHLIDVLHAAGYNPRPRQPDPEVTRFQMSDRPRLLLCLWRLDSVLIRLHEALNPGRLPLDDKGPWRHDEVMWEANRARSLADTVKRFVRHRSQRHA